MKITKNNYIRQAENIGIEELPKEMQDAHFYILKMTDKANDWTAFDTNKSFRTTAELTFKKLEEYLSSKNSLSGMKDSPAVVKAKHDAMMYVYMDLPQLEKIYEMEKMAEVESGLTPEIKIRKKALEQHIRLLKKDEKKEYDPIKEIHFIERFLAFNEKMIQKNTVKMFISDLQKAIQEKKIRKHSPYAKQIVRLQEVAIQFYNRADNVNRLVLSKELLNDLYSVILDFENKISKPEKIDPIDPVDLSGVENETESEIMSSVDFAEMEFAHLGFTDKWLNLIGDPSPGFTAMIYGKPKMGKSYLAVDFARYLAKNMGRVLYVSKEEKFSSTFANKLKEKNAAHENLIIGDRIPEDLSDYNFVFLDSINSLNLSAEDLKKLKEKYPSISFVYVFQTTKTGNFRGTNTFQHDVDIVIEIPERGRAVQFGRFNQGGEMQIFEVATPHAFQELNGTPKKTKYPAWTTPEYLNASDHSKLKHIYDLYKKGKMKEAYDYALHNSDTMIREEIPGDIWKKMGGSLTKTGEEKLKAKKSKSAPAKEVKKKPTIVFNSGVRALKGVIEREWDLELNDGEYIEILDIAQERSENFTQDINDFHVNLEDCLKVLVPAMKEWDKKEGRLDERNKSKFNPAYYAKRKDIDNPSFIFTGTSSKVLAEAIEGDFDLIYMVRRELANRGQDSSGKWVGFDEAKKIHRVE